MPAALPFAVVVDTAVCLNAPEILWLSGIGDIAGKVTAIFDWKLAYHRVGEPVDDFAALLSDATVDQLLSNPGLDLDGMRLLATALMLNGISMAVCGSSRPASGSEHLISHALDSLLDRPRPHGLQVGLAAYIVSHLQRQGTDRILSAFDRTNIWHAFQSDPIPRSSWLEAVRLAPSLKPDRYTILSDRDVLSEVEHLLDTDPRLAPCLAPA